MCFKKKNHAYLTCAFLSLTSLLTQGTYAAQAKAAPSSSQLKLGVVDVQAAILQTNEGKAAKAKIEKEVEQKRQSLLSQQSELKKLEEEFQAQQSVLSDADKLSKQKEFQTKLQKLQSSQISFEQETRQKELAATQQIYQNLIGVVKEISEPEDFDAVLDKGAGVLLYAKKSTDLTQKVISQYNKKHKPKGTN